MEKQIATFKNYAIFMADKTSLMEIAQFVVRENYSHHLSSFTEKEVNEDIKSVLEEEEYLYDDKALEKYRKTHTGSFTLQRYKGLGEMDAEQLWETTLDPERRVLKRVEIEDARMASEVTEMLMGSEVGPRRQFIYEHADEAEIDA